MAGRDMNDHAVVIDLGLLDGPTAPRDPGADRRPPGRLPRHLALLACVALVTATAVTSTAPLPPPLVRSAVLQLQDGDEVAVGPELIMVTSTDEPGAGEGRLLTAYSPVGRLRWRAAASGVGSGMVGATGTSTTVVLYSQADGQLVTSGHARTTGRQLWSVPGLADLSGDPAVALTTEDATPVRGRTDAPQMPTAVVAVDVTSGRTLWRVGYPTRVATAMAPAADGDQVAVGTPDGTVELRQLRTGALTAAARVLPPAAHPDSRLDLIMLGGTLIARDPSSRGVTALDLATLTTRWHRQIAVDGMTRCGDLLCLVSATGSTTQLQALRPATGAVEWQRGDVAMVVGDGGSWLISYRVSASHRLTPVEALDQATGRGLVDLRGWQIATVDGDTLWFTRSLRGRPGSEVGVLRPGGHEVVPTGSTTSIGAACLAMRQYLACRTDGEHLVVWRLRR